MPPVFQSEISLLGIIQQSNSKGVKSLLDVKGSYDNFTYNSKA